VRTTNPVADGRGSAASRTAIGGGISCRRPRGDNLLLVLAACGERVYVTGGCPSVRLSVPSIDSGSDMLLVCYFATLQPIPGYSCRRGVVVSGVRRMNQVNARRARLVPGWVTVFGRVYHLGM